MKQIKKFQIGKNKLTPEFIEQIKRVFLKENFVKIDLLKNSTRDKEEADKIGEEIVGKLGKNFTFKRVGYTLNVKKWRKAQR